MNATELTAALLGFAKSDLRKAKAKGEVIVTETKRGNLSLRHEGGVYTLEVAARAFPVYTPAQLIASGKPAVVAPALADLYSVTVS